MLKSPCISFSAAKDSYHQHDQVQRKVDQNLKNMVFKHLEQTNRNIKHILELGCGDGVASMDIAKQLMPLSYDAVDIADILIDKAKEIQIDHLPIKRGFNFIQGDFNQSQFWQALPQKKYDLIYSNMALQWSDCLLTLLKRINQILSIHGVLAFSIPLNGTFDELKNVVRINQFISHDKVKALFKMFDWQCINIDKQSIQLEFLNRKTQLKHLKSTGVNSYLGCERPQMRMLLGYLRDDNDQMTTLSYEIGIYVIAKQFP
ncbi:methyltransferase [Cysteiniphilum sp. 6C5]|uniref:methyltransferase n=1 Tax=unclassified Cysteiniphilum TaxID=2610889 RepID=UPI003F86AED1